MAKYDYSKFRDPDWHDDWTYQKTESGKCDANEMLDNDADGKIPFVRWPDTQNSFNREYWGIHEIEGGRLEIDVRRFEYACYRCGDHDPYFPIELRDKGELYVPSKAKRYDHTCNYLVDRIANLKKDWDEEYKPLFKKLFSPKDAGDQYRTSTISMFGNSDTMEGIEMNAMYVALQREQTYHRIQSELYCTFLTKVMIEIHRIILRSLSTRLYQNKGYCIRDLKSYCNGAGIDFHELKNRKVYLKYNDIYNFIKHNSIKAYETLRKYNPKCLIDTECEFENGMFAIYWLNPEEVDIDKLLSDIVPFLLDFCEKALREDPGIAKWDYDEYFIETQKELADPMEHFGIYEACGMGPLD